MGKSVDEKIKEDAFQLWRKCGRSPDKTAKALQDKGHRISRQTIDAWKNERGWVARAAEADAVECKANDPQLSGEDRLVASLVTRQQWYENYFLTRGPLDLDTQADYAYKSLITTIQSIRQKTAAYRSEMFTTFLRDLIGWLNLNDPDSVPTIEKNFDDFIAFAKEKYRG